MKEGSRDGRAGICWLSLLPSLPILGIVLVAVLTVLVIFSSVWECFIRNARGGILISLATLTPSSSGQLADLEMNESLILEGLALLHLRDAERFK